MIDIFTLYKKLIAAGIPELQAKDIQKAAFKYIESINEVQTKEYNILINSLTASGLNQDQAEFISDFIRSQTTISINI